MQSAYNSPQEHVDEELARVALMLQRQMHLHWEQGLLPRVKDEFSGTFVSGSEVEALLCGGLPLSQEAEARLLELDFGLAARPFSRLENVEFRLGLDVTGDVQVNTTRHLLYGAVRIVY